MADALTTIEEQILNQDKAAVEALLGAPVKKRRWKNVPPPPGADAVALAAFEASLVDEVWIYPVGRVHFSLAGLAARVDDDVSRDLPPDQDAPLIA
ncbi:MAG TPA: hypothetical protein VF782_11500 [Allosphingosinicella sp.]|jgi:hypothetical protein